MPSVSHDLKLLSQVELADVLGRDRRWVLRQIAAGNIPPAMVDDAGQVWFSRTTLLAAQRRAGELYAEQCHAGSAERLRGQRA
jgi:hypothetical protein